MAPGPLRTSQARAFEKGDVGVLTFLLRLTPTLQHQTLSRADVLYHLIPLQNAYPINHGVSQSMMGRTPGAHNHSNQKRDRRHKKRSVPDPEAVLDLDLDLDLGEARR